MAPFIQLSKLPPVRISSVKKGYTATTFLAELSEGSSHATQNRELGIARAGGRSHASPLDENLAIWSSKLMPPTPMTSI